MLAGTAEAAVGQTINIGNGREISIGELNDKVSKLVTEGRGQIEYVEACPGDVLGLYCDLTSDASFSAIR
jgi:UDP-glucose 4-epimerase